MKAPSPASPARTPLLRSLRARVAAATLVSLSLLPPPAVAELPTPGGAPGSTTGDGARPFTGLADPPRAAAFTGAAVTSIAIEVPPGRAGATPKLELRYSSSQGPGAYGNGWSLPIARVVRSTKHGVPGYDASDTFILETSAGSVELEGVAGSKRFVAKQESSFARIGFDPARNVWRVVDKSGTVLDFGTSAAERTGPDASRADGTYAWLLTRWRDAAGNTIDYTYVSASSGQTSGPGLPSEIVYGGNLRAGVAHIFSVRFVWGSLGYPSVAPAQYHAGFAQARDHLLLAIETYAQATLVRRYAMSHDQDPASGAVRLVGVSLDGFGADASADVALPSTVFTYSDSVVTGWPIGIPSIRNMFADSFPSPGAIRDLGTVIRFDTFDINGDGLVDWIDTRPAVPVVRLGNGVGFAAAVPWPWPSGPRKLREIDTDDGDLVVNVFDIDGDGLPDLVDGRADTCRQNRWCVYRNTGSGFTASPMLWWTPRNDLRHTDSAGNRVLVDVADLNGDGRPDWIDATTYRSESPYWTVHWNTGNGFSDEAYRFRAHRNHISVTREADVRKHLVYGLFDMNGDGLPDFVNSEASTYVPPPGSRTPWHVHLNTGTGFSIEPVKWRVEDPVLDLPRNLNETYSTSSVSTTYMDLVDMTGDGRPDWVRPWTSADLQTGLAPLECAQTPACTPTGTILPPQCCFSHLVYVNTGSSFSAPVPWAAWHDYKLRSYGDSASSSEREFEMLDFDGDGLIDLVEISGGTWRVFRHPASPQARWSPIPAERRGAPDLLRSMLNGVGGETHLGYAPATAYGENRIPFPYWVVAARTLRDGISDTPAGFSDYLYRGGLWSGAEREFRGFRDIWESDGTGLTTATRFHQDDRLQGLPAETKILGPTPCTPQDPMDERDACSPLGDTMRVDTNLWMADGPILLVARTSTPYASHAGLAELAKRTEYAYDAFGNVVTETVSSPSAGTVSTETAYAYTVADGAEGFPERYSVDRPIRTLTRSLGPDTRTLAEKAFLYDEASSDPGRLIQNGVCVTWNSNACARWKTTTYKHDRAGNVIAVIGSGGGVSQTEYDEHLLYGRAVRNAVGHVTESTRDLRNGREISKRAPNGRAFETDYDGLARPIRSWSTGFSRAYPEVLSLYVDGEPGGRAGYVETREIGAAPVVVFFDGLGRRVAIKTIAETEAGERTVVSGRTTYDAAGRSAAEGVTFPSTEPRLHVLAPSDANAPAWTRRLYDDHGRLQQTVLPDGSKTLHDASWPGVRQTVFPNLAGGAHPGKAEIELLDGFERVWRKDVCSAAPLATDPTSCPTGTLLERLEIEFDGLDRPVRVKNGAHTNNPAVTEIDYDGLGNRVRFESSDQGHWAYEYGSDGLLARATDARGSVMTSKYDRIGRLRSQSADGFKARYTYERKGGGTGLVRRIRSQSGSARVSKEFAYDARGRVVRETVDLRAGAPMLRHATSYEYDEADRRVAVTYPTSSNDRVRRVTTAYSRYGRPMSLTAFDGDQRAEIVSSVGYDLLGNMSALRFANGLSDVFVHDTATRMARLLCLRTTRAASPAPTCAPDASDERRMGVARRDSAGNILSLTDTLHAPGSALNDSQTFAYDSLGRLVHNARDDAAAQAFSYDPHGNVTVLDGAAYTYDAWFPHRPALGNDAVIAHDAAGNRTRKGPWVYGYDGLGRLVEIRHGEHLREMAFYDEARARVARLDASSGSVRYYVGGLFEVEGDRIVRHYWLGGRLVASDTIAAPRAFRSGIAGRVATDSNARRDSKTEVVARSVPTSGLTTDAVFVLTLALFLAANLFGPSRTGVAMITAFAFLVATTPLPASARTQQRLSARTALASEVAPGTMLFYHADHVGSPYLVSDHNGIVVEQRRYEAYGRLGALFDERGMPKNASSSDVGYTGQSRDPETGLVYFGSRYYDPELGLFLTPDPQAQFASPYLYGGGNPVNGNDPDGEIFGLLVALLTPIFVSAAVSALASGISAALQGGDFLKSFASGFVNAASGAALGTVVGGLNVAYQLAAGGTSFIEVDEALRAVVEVAARASFTSAVTNAAVSLGDAAGLNSDWIAAIAVVTPLFASLAYDQYLVKDSGAAPGGRSSQRTLARDGLHQANTTVGHTHVTQEAVQGTGWERYGGELLAHNLAEDAPAASGNALRNFVGSTRAVLGNQDHFGRLPASIRGLEAGIDKVIGALPSIAPASDPTQPFRAAVGAATHYVQDHLTLGHMVPGAAAFGGPLGAPIRFVVHQAFGGEIAFRDAQIRATRTLLQRYPLIT